jgi:glycosyltransferase involved in cell wall biosynthesis
MKIVIVSDSVSQGGAAIAASRLAEGLVKLGNQVFEIVCFSKGESFEWKTIEISPVNFSWVARRVLYFPKSISLPILNHIAIDRFREVLHDIKPDVISLHNLHGALQSGWPLEILEVCSRFAPVVWTLHDMWSFTGRCAYNCGCQKFIKGCDRSCPTPDEYPALIPTKIQSAWRKRRYLIENLKNVTSVTPSKWLSLEAKKGLWMNKPVSVIPNGINLDVYKPFDQQIARKALDISGYGPILLSVSTDWKTRWKGGNYLREALNSISDKPVTLMTLGNGNNRIDIDGVNHIHLGYIDHERTKVLAYNAADILIHPSIADNYPNVIAESIACGVPVIGFPIGGVPELLNEKVTGWIAEGIDSISLAKTIDRGIKDIQNGLNLKESCRQFAMNTLLLGKQAAAYLDLFDEVINTPKVT